MEDLELTNECDIVGTKTLSFMVTKDSILVELDYLMDYTYYFDMEKQQAEQLRDYLNEFLSK